METPKIKFDSISEAFLKTAEKTNDNIILVGKAGTGKSTIVNFFKTKTKKKFVSLGTTGVSAINVQGITCHRFFRITVRSKLSGMSNEEMDEIRNIDTFFIDETGMLRGDLFDAIDLRMRKIMKNDLLFGGKQFILVGDLLQLPPVVTDSDDDKKFKEEYLTPFFFSAKNFDISKFKIFELEKIYRQKDEEFITYLNALREGYSGKPLLDFLNKAIHHTIDESKAITIASTNSIVNRINAEELAKLPGANIVSNSKVFGVFDLDDPAPKVLDFKVGARVMLLVNHKDGLYVNGTLGTITGIERASPDDFVRILLDGNTDDTLIGKYTWKKTIEEEVGPDGEVEEKVVGGYIQYPFTLAFALTIHKVQGKTFESVKIDPGNGFFADGQCYVAWSRGKDFKQMRLMKPIKEKDIKASKDVKNFINNNKFVGA